MLYLSENFAFLVYVWYAGSAMAARIPMMATTIINSIRVKPWARLLSLIPFICFLHCCRLEWIGNLIPCYSYSCDACKYSGGLSRLASLVGMTPKPIWIQTQSVQQNYLSLSYVVPANRTLRIRVFTPSRVVTFVTTSQPEVDARLVGYLVGEVGRSGHLARYKS